MRSLPIKPRNRSRRAAKWTAAAVAVVLGAAPNVLAQPDLVPLNVVGPQKVYVDSLVVTHVTVANFGGALVGDYTVQVLLSTDPIVSVDDTVVGSLTTDILGTFPMNVNIPYGITPGAYQWMVRILPAPGEVNTGNNELAGIAVLAIQSLVDLGDALPIHVFVRITDPVAPTPIVIVNNAGTEGDVLIYMVEENATWLTADPPMNFAVAGEPGNETALLIDHHGLDIGTYNVSVTFRNVVDPDDYADLPVTLEVGEARFRPGDRVQGSVGNPGDVDGIVFDGVEGMKLRLKLKTSSGDLKARVALIDPDGEVEKVLKYPHTDKFLKKTVKLERSGEYRLEVSGAGDTYGNYKIKTGRTLPAKAQPHTAKVTAPGGTVKVLLLKDAVLSFICKPNTTFGGPLDLGLMNPAGQAFDISGATSTMPDGYVLVEGLEIDECGAYRIDVSGFGADDGEVVKITVVPVQPKKGNEKVYLP